MRKTMKSLRFGAGLLMLLLLPRLALAQSEAPARPTVAVLDFDYGAVKVQWLSSKSGHGRQPLPTLDALDVGRGVANLLVEQLVRDGDLRLLERQRMADVVREHQGPYANNARYLIMGAITKFGGEQKRKVGAATVALAAFGMAVHRPIAGIVTTKKTYAYVDLSCRVVDTQTGEIVGTANGSGQSLRGGLLLGGLAGGRNAAGGGVSVDSADFQATIMGEATLYAVKDAADKLHVVLRRSAGGI